MISSEAFTVVGSCPIDAAISALRADYPDRTRATRAGRVEIRRNGSVDDAGHVRLERREWRFDVRSQVGVVVEGHLRRLDDGVRFDATLTPMRSYQVGMWILAALLAVAIPVLLVSLGDPTEGVVAIGDAAVIIGCGAGIRWFLRRSLGGTTTVAHHLRGELEAILAGTAVRPGPTVVADD